MESLRKDQILKYNADTLQVVRKTFGLNEPGAMKNAVDILEEWVKQQNHFEMKHFDRRYLETTINQSKGSIERAKSSLDRACTSRTELSHIFKIHDVRYFFETELKDIKHAVVPTMTKNHERIFIVKNCKTQFESSTVDAYIRTLPILGEYIRLNDYAVNNYGILDLLNVSFPELIKVLNLTAVQETKGLVLDCWAFRIKAIYVLTTSKFFDIAFAILKQVISKKIADRFHVLKDKESLLEFFDKDVLPKEYGGNEKPLDELHEEWLNVLCSKNHIEYFKEICSAKTDESLREKGECSTQHAMSVGIPGTFRSLCID